MKTTIRTKGYGDMEFWAQDRCASEYPRSSYVHIWKGEWKQIFDADGSAITCYDQHGLTRAARRWWERRRRLLKELGQ